MLDTQDYLRIRDLDDIEAIERMPLEERLEFTNTYDLIGAGVALDANKVAVYFHPHGDPKETPEAVTYGAIWKRINQAANFFHDLGVGPGERIAYLMPTIPDLHAVIIGGQAAGIVAPVNWMLEPGHIATILRAVAPKLLVAMAPTPGYDIWEKVEAIKDDIPSVDHIVQVSGPESIADADRCFGQALESYDGGGLSFNRDIRLGDTAACMHTGGTTGVPKITKNTHLGILYQIWAGVQGSALRADDTVWAAGPSFHVAVISGGGIGPLALGSTTINPGPLGFRHKAMLENYWQLMERYEITRLYGVPTILTALVHLPADDVDFSRIRFSTSSSSPLPIEVSYSLERKTGQKIGLIYGLTETTASITCHPRNGEIRHGSSGLRRPYTHIRATITDESGRIERDCAINEIGILFVKGPGLIPGYLDPTFDADAFTEDGWFNTGDLGRIDEDGYIWVTGRTKDLIIRSGHNIDPRLIEEPLYEHPAVELVGAVGRPDPYVGEMPVAFVQLKPGAQTSAEELKRFAREQISERAASPVEILIVETIPLTGVGKVIKQQLRFDAARRTFAGILAELQMDGLKVTVEVASDSAYGTLVTVTLADDLSEPDAAERETIERQVHEVMNPFAMHHEIKWA